MSLLAGNVTAPCQPDLTGSQGVFLGTVNKLQFNNNVSRVKVIFALLESVSNYHIIAVLLALYTGSCCAFGLLTVDGFISSLALVS